MTLGEPGFGEALRLLAEDRARLARELLDSLELSPEELDRL